MTDAPAPSAKLPTETARKFAQDYRNSGFTGLKIDVICALDDALTASEACATAAEAQVREMREAALQISNDFVPDREDQAMQALEEMRGAIMALALDPTLAATKEPS